MLIIYHSRELLTARLAGVLHTGASDALPDLPQLWSAVGSSEGDRGVGLWKAGTDEHGHAVCAVGRASRPDVVERAFHGLARIFGIAPTSYLLVPVGQARAWVDLLALGLRRIGLVGVARALEVRLLRRRLRECREAVRLSRRLVEERAEERAGARVASVAGEDSPEALAGSPSIRIIYHCYGQAHSSVTAANIHLGHLPRHRRATFAEIIHQPCFDRTRLSELGDPWLMGTDERGDEIYVIGLAGGNRAMKLALSDFLHQSGIDPTGFLFANALQHAGLPMRIGGYTSRRLGLIWPGRPLSAAGVWLRYPRFVRLVEQVRNQVRSRFP